MFWFFHKAVADVKKCKNEEQANVFAHQLSSFTWVVFDIFFHNKNCFWKAIGRL